MRPHAEQFDSRYPLQQCDWKTEFGSSAHIAQLVEHSLGKGEVAGSNPAVSTSKAAVSGRMAPAV